MDYLNRISQPSSVASFSQQHRNGADDALDDYGWASRNKARESKAPAEGRGFASILARLVEG